MGAKELFSYALLMILTIGAGMYVMGKGEPKILQQKIVQTNQTISTMREWASTFAGISVTKDFAGLNMASLKAKGLFTYEVSGSGTDSYIPMPFDDTIQASIKPSSNNKQFIITISLTDATNLDDNSKQIFEDNLNSDNKTSASSITSYTAVGADGIISLQFGN